MALAGYIDEFYILFWTRMRTQLETLGEEFKLAGNI